MMHQYLDSPSGDIFRIEENAGAWVWVNNDSTAALGPQLAEILEETAALLGGIPSLTSLLCVATALRHWESDVVWADRLRSLAIHDGSETDNVSTRLHHLVRWFDQVARFSESLRTGPYATAAIFACGLQERTDLLEITDLNTIKNIIHYLRQTDEDRPNLIDSQTLRETLPGSFVQDYCGRCWETLNLLRLNVANETQLKNWRRTGLKDLPLATAAEPLDQPPTFASAFAALEQHDQYSGLAQFSRRLSGMISLPRRPADPDNLPIGGVSDVTNRGNPERLLMTELAAEPMVLLARIANGQALYMRREMPPGPSAKLRHVLVESTIQCWGLSRVRMAALALAVAVSEKKRLQRDTGLFILAGDKYKEIDATSADGLLELIEELCPEAHPGAALWSFLEDRKLQRNHAGEADEAAAEPLVVLTASTFRDSEFQRILRDVTTILLLGIVDRDGSTRVVRQSSLGQEVIQTLRLDLEPQQLRLGVKTSGGGEPMFVHQKFPPMAFSGCSRELEWMVSEANPASPEVWHSTSDHRLLYYCDANHGGEEITDLLPAAHVMLAESRPEHVDFVSADNAGQHFLISADANSHELRVRRLGFWRNDTTYCFSGEYLLQFCKKKCQVFGREDGQSLISYETDRRHVGGCFQADEKNYIWIHGGAAPHDWHRIKQVQFFDSGRIGCVVQNDENNIFVVSSDFRWLAETHGDENDREEKVTRFPIEIQDGQECNPWPVAHSGNRKHWVIEVDNVGVKGSKQIRGLPRQRFLFDLGGGRTKRVALPAMSESIRLVSPRAYQMVRRRPIRRRARAVTLSDRGIVFEKDSSNFFRLELASNQPRRLTVQRYREAPPQKTYPFGDPYRLGTSGAERQWTLRRADLPGGVCWHDSRGLFHFKRDDDPHELTLAFSDSHVAGWFSQTGLFGPRYFFPASTQLSQDVLVGEGVIKWLKDWWLQA